MEIWKSVDGWVGFYEVSNEGRVRSIDRVHAVINRFGNVENRRQRGQMLKLTKSKNGYLIVSFTRPGGVREYHTVHTLVARTFIGPTPPGCEVCHNDGDRTHNRFENLRYDSRSANALDRHRHGTMNQAHGEDHYFRKLCDEDVRWIRKMAGSVSNREMGRALGVTHGTIGHVINGESWKHVA